MPPVVAILVTAFLFYLLIPAIGAFAVRSRWRRFRRTLVEASTWPNASLEAARRTEPGRCRFLGTLAGLQGDDAIWLRGERLSVTVEMESSEIYLLPPSEGEVSDEPPRHLRWRQVTSLTEGTRFFAAGRLSLRDGRATITGDRTDPVIVVVYDGPTRTLLRRGTWSARQRNEYWNRWTPAALAAGVVALATIGYVLIRAPLDRIAALLAVSLAAFPILPFLPPGVVFFFVFRLLWRRGRLLRAYRDILRLPLRHLHDASGHGTLPEGQAYALRPISPESAQRYGPDTVVLDDPLRRAGANDSEAKWTVCGQIDPDSELLAVPSDPISERMIIGGDPARLSERCQRGARRLELLSAAVVGIALTGNLYLVFWLLLLLTR